MLQCISVKLEHLRFRREYAADRCEGSCLCKTVADMARKCGKVEARDSFFSPSSVKRPEKEEMNTFGIAIPLRVC